MIRIVKMTFQEDKVGEFLDNFNTYKQQIKNFEGVNHLELLNDKSNTAIFFTYSIWQSEEHLENYRKSDLFKNVWAQTKPLFKEKAEAWSVNSIVNLD